VKHTQKGRKSEDIAVSYLQKEGYMILARNWRYGKKEVDIISQKDNYLVVTEVKSGLPGFMMRPEEAVSMRKQRMIIEVTEAFILQKSITSAVRFDIIFVTGIDPVASIEHITDAFYPV